MKDTEKIISHEMLFNQAEHKAAEQAVKREGNPFRKIEAEEIKNIRTEFAAMSADTVATPPLQKEQALQKKPKNKAVKIMKEVWERIKAAGNALFTPKSQEEASFITGAKPTYLLLMPSEQTDQSLEFNPWEKTVDFMIEIMRRIFEAGKAISTPREKGKTSATATRYKPQLRVLAQ
jgi:hypothetical protein